VQVDERHARLSLERLVDAVALVHVDVDVGDRAALRERAQQLRQHDRRVVVEAVHPRLGPARVMEPGDRHERSASPARQQRIRRVEHRAHHVTRRPLHVVARRRRPMIEAAVVLPTARGDALHERALVKRRELVVGRRS
jgi:hypothetical protein